MTATRTRDHDPNTARAGRTGSDRSRSPLRLRTLTLDWSRTYVLGVLNVTPDSFSDGGRYAEVEAAVDRGRVDSPPTSMRSAPASHSSRPRTTAASTSA